MGIMRVKPDVALVHFRPDGTAVQVVTDMAFDSEDPVVREHPEWFQVDARVQTLVPRVTAVAVEDTSATPGRLRNR